MEIGKYLKQTVISNHNIYMDRYNEGYKAGYEAGLKAAGLKPCDDCDGEGGNNANCKRCKGTGVIELANDFFKK